MSLIDLVDNEKTDKNTIHSYLEVYEKLFNPLKHTAKNVLEIGIYKGGSIKLWHDYFENATIFGMDVMNEDIDVLWKDILNNNRIKIYSPFDAYHQTNFDRYLLKFEKEFDIIIDDGPHSLKSMIFCIENYLKLLNNKGILVIEDIQHESWIPVLCSYVPDEYKKFIQVYDGRSVKGRYDDILFCINFSI